MHPAELDLRNDLRSTSWLLLGQQLADAEGSCSNKILYHAQKPEPGMYYYSGP
jgi:hypothetical protein